ncbi:lysophospholipid acyltransferase family protein [Metamycoplasma neophronis]|uniref:1-acyl-sn-glycerol-3-phosphate acyltransferase n=1 Tax=Metamycoplasma neophronis TaxID=872983 RepID=A0ABY2Z2G5_9BACT|nr:lysophospholipid acyltransferase family protein [Metamycoplasma neophronis]TPR54316.1 1-acyl-sn-glycerol-3-phosphate acyltransferase [Metamycoplasma neophronis]
MKLKTRAFWRLLPIMTNIWILKSKANRHKKMPEYYKVSERNHFLQKHLTNILRHLNIELKVEGFENVPNGPCLIVPNHSTYIDPLILFSALYSNGDGHKISKTVNFIARVEAKSKRRVRKIAELGDTHYIDPSKPREALVTLTEFGKFVKKNKSCGVIFPEGTRTKDGKLGQFNSGVFKLAQSTFLPIVPVTINNAANALDWKRKDKLVVTVTFHGLMKPQQFQTLPTKSLAEQVKDIVASNYVDQIITSKETIKNTYTKKLTEKAKKQ